MKGTTLRNSQATVRMGKDEMRRWKKVRGNLSQADWIMARVALEESGRQTDPGMAATIDELQRRVDRQRRRLARLATTNARLKQGQGA